jgi:hypothetical protein
MQYSKLNIDQKINVKARLDRMRKHPHGFADRLALQRGLVFSHTVASDLDCDGYRLRHGRNAVVPVDAICRILCEQANAEDTGYEMGCLISAEFTPAPTFDSVLTLAEELCERLNVAGGVHGLMNVYLKPLGGKSQGEPNKFAEIYYVLNEAHAYRTAEIESRMHGRRRAAR